MALKKAEMERVILQSEMRYRSLFEDSPVAMWEEDFSGAKACLDRLNAQGVTDFSDYLAHHPETVRHCAAHVRILDANKAALALFDARSVDDFRDDLPSIFTDQAAATFQATLAAAAEGKQRFEAEYTGKTLSGERKDLRLKWSVVPGYEASLGKVIVTLVDITDQKRAERILRKAHDELEMEVAHQTAELIAINRCLQAEIEEQNRTRKRVWEAKRMLRTVVDGISEPLVMIDRHLTVRMLNEAALTYYGLADYSDAVGRPCFKAFKGLERVCEECFIAPAARNRTPVTYERKGLFDPERVEQVAFYPVKETVDGLPGGIIRVSDVTEKKKVDEQMIRADRLSSLGQLSAGIAHEIRNPLSGIRLFVDILGDPERFARTDMETEILGDITNNIDKIEGIIKRVLDFARHADPDLSQIDINGLIRDSLMLWQPRMGKNQIRATLDLAETLPPLAGDRIGIQQVMNNLIQNALEAMEKGGELKIATTGSSSSFHHRRRVILISVQDSGAGVPDEAKNNIFNPFFTTKLTGTGLGLSICHQIVERHGGFIAFESRPGDGTVFWVELPVER